MLPDQPWCGLSLHRLCTRAGQGVATAVSIGGRLARVQTRPEASERPAAAGTSGGREAVQRWRLVVRRDALAADLGQREQLAAWAAGLAAAGLPIVGLDQPSPRPRFAIGAVLAPAIPAEAELVDVWLSQRLPRWRVREALATSLPAGHALVDLHDVWLGEGPLPGRVRGSVYRATIGPPADSPALAAAAAGLLAAASLPRERRRGGGVVSYDLRPFLADLAVEPAPEGGATVRITLRHDPSRGVGRPEEVLAALGEAMGAEALPIGALVRERLLLADPPMPAPAEAASAADG